MDFLGHIIGIIIIGVVLTWAIAGIIDWYYDYE